MEFAENDAKHRGELVAPATFVFSENKGHDYEHMRSYFENLNFQNRYSTMHLKPKRWIAEFLSADRLLVQPHQALRSETRRAGKTCVRQGRSGWGRYQ